MGKEFTDDAAFTEAYEEYFDVVYKEALDYSGNHHAAEEIAQEVFLIILTHTRNAEKKYVLKWMLMTAKCRALNYLRDNGRLVPMETLSVEDDKHPIEFLEESSEDTTLDKIKQERYHELETRIFQELNEKNRRWYDAVTMTYYLGIPQKEVAEEMNITLYSLEGMLKRARKWMVKRYKAQYDHLHDL